MAVTIDDDVFIDMLWARVDEFCPDSYSHEFWEAAFNYLKDVGWNPNPSHNTPSYIVDNIYVNGEVRTLEEIRDNYSFAGINMDEMSDEELGNYITEEEDWMSVGDRYVRRWGL